MAEYKEVRRMREGGGRRGGRKEGGRGKGRQKVGKGGESMEAGHMKKSLANNFPLTIFQGHSS